MPAFDIDGISVNFPFTPYSIQVEYMRDVMKAINSKQNAMLESPTGTGKKADIPNRCLDDLQKKPPKPQKSNSLWDDYKKATTSVPPEKVADRKLIYCSRTHSQISQVVRELRKTEYRPKTMVLGSRELLCIHEEISKMRSSAQNTACRSLGMSCSYKCNVGADAKSEIYDNKNLSNAGVMDIEDLYKYGKKNNLCPYYLSRYESLMLQAEVILMPYNYIMDKFIRESLPFDLTDCVIIIDEAHNIDSFCLESMSIDITSKTINDMQKEVESLIKVDVSSREGKLAGGSVAEQKNKENEIEKSLVIAKQLLINFENELLKIINVAPSKEMTKKGSFIINFLKAIGIDINSYAAALTCFTTVVDKYTSYFPNAHGNSTEILVRLLKLVFPDETMTESTADKWRFVGYMTEVNNFNKETHRWEKERYPSLGFWCMDCSISMKDLQSTGVCSIIFTSGTLSPMNQLLYEFQIPIPIVLENMHVIDSSQLCVVTVDKSKKGFPLSSSYQSRQNPRMKEEIIETILLFIPEIRGNIIVFFPSYGYLNDCYLQWQRSGYLQKLTAFKDLFREEPGMSNEAFATVVDGLKSAIYRHGAVLFAVCRGKASEGIDFSDDVCRCVMIAGIPYLPYADLRIRMRREYLDDKDRQQKALNDRVRQAAARGQDVFKVSSRDLPLASLACLGAESFNGSDWYNVSAYRAVNQSVGRVIRHRDDFGMILLIDERFRTSESVNSLSKWMRPFYKEMESADQLKNDIGVFFAKKMGQYVLPRKTHSAQKGSQTSVEKDTKPSVSFASRLESADADKETKHRKGINGLFNKIRATKAKVENENSDLLSQNSSSLTVSQDIDSRLFNTPQKSVKHSVIESDSDEMNTAEEEVKRKRFCSRLKTSAVDLPVPVTPQHKGIQRFFHSDEMKRPELTESGSLLFRQSGEKGSVGHDLFKRSAF